MKGKLYVFKDGELREVRRARYRPVAPSIRTDSIPLEYNHGTGMWHDSRSARRAAEKAAGVVSVGHDWKPAPRTQPETDSEIREDLEATYHEIRDNGNPYLSEQEIQQCKVEDAKLGRE